MALKRNKVYRTISVREQVADQFKTLRTAIGMETTEALQVCMAAYDVINSTRFSGRFKEAVDAALKEDAKSV